MRVFRNVYSYVLDVLDPLPLVLAVLQVLLLTMRATLPPSKWIPYLPVRWMVFPSMMAEAPAAAPDK